jgi:predicted porin
MDVLIASVSAGFGMTDAEQASKGEDTEFTVGVNVPFGAFAVSAGFASSKTEVGSTTTAKASGFGLGATYAFSKRTKAYAGFRSVENKNAAGAKTKDETLYAVGVRHDF